MRELMGDEAFEMKCILSHHGTSIKMNTLIDTGAQGYLFIDRKLAFKLHKRFGATLETTTEEARVAGYEGIQQKTKQVLTMSLQLGDRHWPAQHFVVLNMARDLIVGKKFMADHDLLADSKNCSLISRDQITIHPREPDYVAIQPIQLPRKLLFQQKIQQHHQADMARRDALFELSEDKKLICDMAEVLETDELPVYSNTTFRSDYQESMKAMKTELGRLYEVNNAETQICSIMEVSRLKKVRRKQHYNSAKADCQRLNIDICELNPVAFKSNMKDKENAVFMTSIHEIDTRISELRNEREAVLRKTKRREKSEADWYNAHSYTDRAINELFSPEDEDEGELEIEEI